MAYNREQYRAWAAKNRSRLRAYRTQWAREHRVWKLKQCEQTGCTKLISARRHYCDEDRLANQQFKWVVQNNRRQDRRKTGTP